MALQSCHHHDDCRVAPPPLPDWGWEWEWDWEELVRCQLGDAARDGIHGALPGLPSCKKPTANLNFTAWDARLD